jgi:hypothetical protein
MIVKELSGEIGLPIYTWLLHFMKTCIYIFSFQSLNGTYNEIGFSRTYFQKWPEESENWPKKEVVFLSS